MAKKYSDILDPQKKKYSDILDPIQEVAEEDRIKPQENLETTKPKSVLLEKTSPFFNVNNTQKQSSTSAKMDESLVPKEEMRSEYKNVLGNAVKTTAKSIVDFSSNIPDAIEALYETQQFQVPRALGSATQMLNQVIASQIQPPGVPKSYDPNASILTNISENLRDFADNREKELGTKDTPGYKFGQGLSSILTSLAGGIVGGVIGGVPGAIAAGFGTSAMLEGGLAYDDAIKYGADPKTATKVGLTVGTINGVLEFALPAKYISKFGKVIAKGATNEVLKKGLFDSITKEVGAGGLSEFGTEYLQEVVNIIAENTYKETKDKTYWDEGKKRAFESGLYGGLVGIFTGGVGNFSSNVLGKAITKNRVKKAIAEQIDVNSVNLPDNITDQFARDLLNPKNAQYETMPKTETTTKQQAGDEIIPDAESQTSDLPTVDEVTKKSETKIDEKKPTVSKMETTDNLENDEKLKQDEPLIEKTDENETKKFEPKVILNNDLYKLTQNTDLVVGDNIKVNGKSGVIESITDKNVKVNGKNYSKLFDKMYKDDELVFEKTDSSKEKAETKTTIPEVEKTTKNETLDTEKVKQKKPIPNVKKTKDYDYSEKLPVYDVPLGDIKVNTENFQNREKPYSEESVKKMTDDFRILEFDPILLWENIEGEHIVLSGHSRFEAHKRLAKTDNNFKKIPAKIIEAKTLSEAKEIAERSNTLATRETPIERAKIYRDKRLGGASKAELEREARKYEGRAGSKILNLSHLNKDGTTLLQLSSMQSSNSSDFHIIDRIADYIGELKNRNPQLTDMHEEELYRWLYDDFAHEKFRSKTKFNDYVSKFIDHDSFNAKEPLGVRKDKVVRSSETIKLDVELTDLRKQRTKLEKQRKDFEDGKELLPIGLTPKEYLSEFTKKIADVNNLILKVTEEKRKAAIADRSQDDLFSQISEEIGSERTQEIIEGTAPKELEKLTETAESTEQNKEILKRNEVEKELKKLDEFVDDGLFKKSKEDAKNKPIVPFEIGEKIGGARKDFAKLLKDAEDFNIKEVPLSKSFPIPNYQKMLKDGVEPEIVAWVRVLRDSIRKRNRSGYEQDVKSVRQVAGNLLDGTIKLSDLRDKFRLSGLRLIENVELYKKFGHEFSFNGIVVEFGKGSFKNKVTGKLESGERWWITNERKSPQFKNKSGVLLVAETKDEMYAEFKKIIDSIDTKNEPRRTKFEIYKYKRGGDAWIGKKVGRNTIDLVQVKSFVEAREYLKNNYDKLVELLEKRKYIPNERKDTNSVRVGKDYRSNLDVLVEDFQEAFEFRGVEFGNWVKDNAERQQFINETYDALRDLSTILNIPTQAISLNKTLGLAFGARGRGGKKAASAHYEAAKTVINLTRRKGAGSLAHEWFHALDNMFGKQRGGIDDFITEKSYKDSNIRPETLKAFNNLIAEIKKTEIGKRSEKLDSVRSKPYWSTTLEVAARSFESYIIEKLQKKGYSNDFLVNVKKHTDYLSDVMDNIVKGEVAIDVYPYLLENEIPGVVTAFDNLFSTLKTEKTDVGTKVFEESTPYRKNNVEFSELIGSVENAEYLIKAETEYIKTDEAKFDEDIEETVTKAFRPLYYVVHHTPTSADNVGEFHSLVDAYKEVNYYPDDRSRYDNVDSKVISLYLEPIWVASDGEIISSEEAEPVSDFTEKEIPKDAYDRFDGEVDIYYKDFEGSETNSAQLLMDVEDGVKQAISGLKTIGGVDYNVSLLGSGKYSTIQIQNTSNDKEFDIGLRIAEHRYNPRNNNEDERAGKFISIEISNSIKSKVKYTQHSFEFDGDTNIEEIYQTINDEIDEIVSKFGDELEEPSAPYKKDLINTPAFKEWFGNSKVVDDAGNPLIVYHGGIEGIEVFNEDYGGDNTADNEFGAFYFSNEKAVGEDYSREAFKRRYQDNPQGLIDDGILPDGTDLSEIDYDYVADLADERIKTVNAYLSLQNPLVIEAEYKGLRELEKDYPIQEIIGFIKGKGNPPEILYDLTEFDKDDIEDYRDEINERAIENNSLDSDGEIKSWMFEGATREILEENDIYQELPDYDGIIIKNVYDDISDLSSIPQDVYIVLNPNDIKSVENRGTFSQYDDNILRDEQSLFGKRTDLQALQDKKKHLELSLEELERTKGLSIDARRNYPPKFQRDVDTKGRKAQIERELLETKRAIRKKLAKEEVKKLTGQFDIFTGEEEKPDQLSMFESIEDYNEAPQRIQQVFDEQLGFDFKKDNSTEYFDKKGKSIRFSHTKRDNPSYRKLEEGEYSHVEGRYSKYGELKFFARKEKITSPDDVAYLFRQLEDARTENLFVLHIRDDGKKVVQHISSGNVNSTTMDAPAIVDMIGKFGSTEIYLVHNHPSGRLESSSADRQILRRMQKSAKKGVKVHNGIIIDTNQNKYGIFYASTIKDPDTWEYKPTPDKIKNTPKPSKMIPLKALRFSRQSYQDVEMGTIITEGDVSKFLTEVRFNAGKKYMILSLNNANKVVGRFYLTSTEYGKEMADEIAALVVRSAGRKVIFASNRNVSWEVKNNLEDHLKGSDIEFLDAVQVHPSPENSFEGYKDSRKDESGFVIKVKKLDAFTVYDVVGRDGEIVAMSFDTKTKAQEWIDNNSEVNEESTPYKKEPFYSKVERLVNEKAPNKNITKEQIVPMLIKNGAKKEELDWLDLETFFDENPKPTKLELVDYIRLNNVAIKVVGKGGSKTTNDIINKYEKDGFIHFVFNDGTESTVFSTAYNNENDLNEAAVKNRNHYESNTKYSDYQLPGGENYREFLITLPKTKSGGDFKSSHFNEENVLLHYRVNDRIINGKKTLFVEEIQSDWHQKGRKKGYRKSQTKQEIQNYHSNKIFAKKYSELTVEDKAYVDREVETKGEFIRYSDSQKVPNAPFKKSWHELGMKHIIQKAISEGYEQIAFTTGQQQADRYDLSKQINSLTYNKTQKQLLVWDKNNDVQKPIIVELSKLEDYVGKDIAKKIIDSNDDLVEVPGVDLKVGGEGMAGFYDKMLPIYLNKFGKKFGAKVGSGEINSESVHTYPITDKMKSSISKQGQPLFEPETSYNGNGKSDDNTLNELPSIYVTKKAKLEKGLDIYRQLLTEFGKDNNFYADWVSNMVNEYGNKFRKDAFKIWEETKELHEERELPFKQRFTPHKVNYIRNKLSSRKNAPILLPDEITRQIIARRLQNRYNRSEQLVEIVRKGKEITDDHDFYQRIELYMGRASDRIEKFQDRITNKKDGFIKKLFDAGFSIDDFGEYLYLKYAPVRNAEIFERNGNKDGSGISTKQANENIKKFEGTKIEKLAEEFRELVTRENAKILLDGGLISQDEYNSYIANEYYVPVKGIGEVGSADYRLTGSGFSVKSRGIHRAEGRGSIPNNPFIQSIVDLEDNIVRAEKNRVGLTVVRFMKENPDIELSDGRKLFEMKNHKNKGKSGKFGERNKFDSRFKLKDSELFVWVDGKRHLVTINDMAMVRGLKNLGVENGFKALQGFNTYFRNMVTLLSPSFAITNLSRDLQTALMNISAEDADVLHRKVLKDIPIMIRDIWRVERGKTDTKSTRWYKEFGGVGAKTGWFASESVEDKIKSFAKKVKKLESQGKISEGFDNTLKFIGDINQAIEYGTRVAIYKNLREAGISKERAGKIAKNITVNFNKKGEWGGYFNSLYMFSNAGIQGGAVILRALKSRRVQKFAAGMVVAQMMLTYINRLIDEDDYDKINEYTRDTNWIMMLPNKKHLKIKLPYGYNVFPVSGMIAMDLMQGKTTFGDGLVRMFNAVVDGFNPIGAITSLTQVFSPTVSDPIFQIVDNENFFGGKIHPTQPPYSPKVANSTLYYRSVSPFSLKIARTLNNWSGGDEKDPLNPQEFGEYEKLLEIQATKKTLTPKQRKRLKKLDKQYKDVTSGWLDFSPESLDHLITSYSGGLGKFVMNIATTTTNLIEGVKVPMNRIPLLRVMIGESNNYSERRIVYEMLNESKRTQFTEKERKIFSEKLKNVVNLGLIDAKKAKSMQKTFNKGQGIASPKKKVSKRKFRAGAKRRKFRF